MSPGGTSISSALVVLLFHCPGDEGGRPERHPGDPRARAADRQEALELLADVDELIVESGERRGQGRRGGHGRQHERANDRDGDERGAPAEIEAGDRGRIADPPVDPAQTFLVGVEPDEQEQRSQAEQDEQ